MSLDWGQLLPLSLLNYRCVPWCSRSFQILHAAVFCDIFVQNKSGFMSRCVFVCLFAFKGQQTSSAAVKMCFVLVVFLTGSSPS